MGRTWLNLNVVSQRIMLMEELIITGMFLLEFCLSDNVLKASFFLKNIEKYDLSIKTYPSDPMNRELIRS